MRSGNLNVHPQQLGDYGDVEEGVESMPELRLSSRWIDCGGNVDDLSLLRRSHISPASCLPDATMAADDDDDDDDDDENRHDGHFGIDDDDDNDDDRGDSDGRYRVVDVVDDEGGTTSTGPTEVVRCGAALDDGFSYAPPAAADDAREEGGATPRGNRLSPVMRRCDRRFFASFLRNVRSDKVRRERFVGLAVLIMLTATIIALSIALSKANGRLSSETSASAAVPPTGDGLLGGGDGAAVDGDVPADVGLSNRPDLSSWIGINTTAGEKGEEGEEAVVEEGGGQQVNSTAAATDEDLNNVLEEIGSWTNSTDNYDDDLLVALSTKPDFSTLLFAIESAGLHDVLSGDGPYTIFAPTNSAFATLSAETLEYLLRPENVDRLRNVVLYHVLDGLYVSFDLPSGSVPTLRTTSSSTSGMGGGEDEDTTLLIDAMSTTGNVTLDGRANVIILDASRARNGVVHAIDHVLLPDDVAALATSDHLSGGGGGEDFLDANVPVDDSSSTNATDDFLDSLLSLDDDQNDVDDGGALHDDVYGTSGEDEYLMGDDVFDGFLELDGFVADNFTDDTFPSRDDWYEDNDNLTSNLDEWSDQPVESSVGSCFSDITCCFFFICR